MYRKRKMTECPICYEEITPLHNNCVTECGHTFCLKCIVTCLNSNIESPCPICRTPIGPKKEEEEEEEEEDDESDAYTEDHPLICSMRYMNKLLRIDKDATSQSFVADFTKYDDDYCMNKFNIRLGVFDALSGLKDEEWKMAEYDILKTISKYYGKKEMSVWDEEETLGLSNKELFDI